MPPIPFWVARRLALGIVAAAALGVVTGFELDSTGGLPDWAVIVLASVVGILGPIESVARTVRDWFGFVGFDARLNVEEAAKTALVALTQVTALDWTEVGITVFRVTRARWHLIAGIQERIARVRLESTPRPSTVIWTKNKGILGQCWREGRDKSLDHKEFYAPYQHITTKDEWKRLPDDVRMGLKFRDFIDIRDFGFVLASPMKGHRHGYCGCFVVQVPSEKKDELSQPAALEVIHTGAATACAVLG